MTISHAASTGVSTTTGARGTTSTSVAYVGVSAGRMGILTVCTKPSTATLPSTVTDGAGKVWDKVTDGTGGTGTNAADTGTSRIAKYVRVFDGAETGSVSVTASNSPSQVCGAMDVYSTSAGGWLSPISVTASDASHGTNPSATASTVWSAALAAGDLVHVGYATDTDDSTAASGHNITQTSVTFGTVTARSRVGNSDGNDGSVFTWDAPVNSGGSTNQPQFSMTWSINSCGPFGGLRLREYTPLAYTRTTVDAFTGTTINATDWDNWGGAQVTQNNQIQLATTTTAGAYFGIQRQATTDLAVTPVASKVVNVGNMALASYTGYIISCQFSTNNDVYWTVSGGFIRFFTQVSATQTQRVIFPYLSDTHRYFAVGFSGGNLLAMWSKDGSNWVVEYSVANPFSGDTVGIPYLMVGTDSAEASTTNLQLDDYSTLANTTPVSQTLDARWIVYNEVGSNLDARWRVANEVASALDTRWAVLSTISTNLDARWAVLSSLSQTLDARWRVANEVSSALDARWISYVQVSNTLDARWRVSNEVSGALDARWRVASVVSQTLDARWSVLNAISQSLDSRWLVRNQVSNALDAQWRVFNAVSSALDARWAVLNAISQALDARWIVRNEVSAALDARWNVDGTNQSVSNTLDARWRVLNQVAADLDARWRVVNEVSNALDARWRVANVVESALDARWAVLNSVAATLDARWAVLAEVSATLDARWRQFQEASNALDVRWASAGQVSSSIEALWRVSGVVSGTLDARWAVRSQINTTLDIRWRVNGLVTASLQALWNSAASEVPVPSSATAYLTQRFRVSLDAGNILYLPNPRIRVDLGRID